MSTIFTGAVLFKDEAQMKEKQAHQFHCENLHSPKYISWEIYEHTAKT